MNDIIQQASFPRRRRSRLPLYLFLLVVLGLGGGAAYWYLDLQNGRFGQVYTQLGIEPLPILVEWRPSVQTELDRLRREPCYRDAVVKLANDLLDAGYPREAATGLMSFAKRCGGARQVLPTAYEALQRIGDFQGSLEIAKQLVEIAPENGTFRYWRADAYDQLGDVADALTDYMNSIELVGNLRNVVRDAFYKLAHAYDKLGRPCDAIGPIELYVSLDPAHRRTPQNTKVISDYATKGHCETQHANGTARLTFAGSDVHILPATINGATGSFILDTGASFVAVTRQFATKAKIASDSGGHITLHTAGGEIQAEIGHAGTVAVGKAEAANVIVAINNNTGDSFGQRIDGLLGMSFLSRFNLNIRPNGIELTAIPLDRSVAAEGAAPKGKSR
jgi:clan AA aspartic protease (TIGR02281 family)